MTSVLLWWDRVTEDGLVKKCKTGGVRASAGLKERRQTSRKLW